MNELPSIFTEEQWLAIDAGFADIFCAIPKPIDPARLREATPLTFITPRELPTDRDDFTRDADSSGA